MRLVMRGDSYVRPPLSIHRVIFHGGIGASMSLVGLLPPLCDNGNMLIDGGYGKPLSIHNE